MQTIWTTGFFFEGRLHWQFKVGRKILQTDIFRLCIYLSKNKTIIHSFYMYLTTGGKNLSLQKDVVQLL
jgi:hypothetical protein